MNEHDKTDSSGKISDATRASPPACAREGPGRPQPAGAVLSRPDAESLGPHSDFGEELSRQRHARGLRLDDISRHADVSVSYLSKTERGLVKLRIGPALRVIRSVAESEDAGRFLLSLAIAEAEGLSREETAHLDRLMTRPPAAAALRACVEHLASAAAFVDTLIDGCAGGRICSETAAVPEGGVALSRLRGAFSGASTLEEWWKSLELCERWRKGTRRMVHRLAILPDGRRAEHVIRGAKTGPEPMRITRDAWVAWLRRIASGESPTRAAKAVRSTARDREWSFPAVRTAQRLWWGFVTGLAPEDGGESPQVARQRAGDLFRKFYGGGGSGGTQ